MRKYALPHIELPLPVMRKQQRYILKFGRVVLPRSKYHSTKKGARGYSRVRIKRINRRERREHEVG